MSAEILYQANLLASITRTLASKIGDVVSVKDFGAVGDGVNDDTAAFQSALAYARDAYGSVFVPLGRYVISETLQLVDANHNPPLWASLIGQGAIGTTLVSSLTGTDPLILCQGSSGAASTVRVSGMALTPGAGDLYQGVGIEIDGTCSVCVEQCQILSFNYGIWVHNDGPGDFSELNMFRDLWVDDCTNAIRLEQGSGGNSFHGTSFLNVAGNAYHNRAVPQTYLNFVSGFWYNFNLGLHIWTHEGATALHTDGVGTGGFGSIQIECQDGNALLSGAGRLWWTGSLDVNGTVTDITSPNPGSSGVACSNYFSAGAFTSPNLPSGVLPIYAPTTTAWVPENYIPMNNGAHPLIFGMMGTNIASVGVASSNDPGNGFYILSNIYQAKIEDSVPGFFLAGSGRQMTSYAASCSLGINGQPGDQLVLNVSGRHTGNMGNFATGVVPANTSTPVTVLCGYPSADVVQHLSFRLVGANYDYRYVFLINHDGFGANGYLALLATLRTFGGPAPGGFGVDNAGNFVFTANVGEDLTYIARAVGIGVY